MCLTAISKVDGDHAAVVKGVVIHRVRPFVAVNMTTDDDVHTILIQQGLKIASGMFS